MIDMISGVIGMVLGYAPLVFTAFYTTVWLLQWSINSTVYSITGGEVSGLTTPTVRRIHDSFPDWGDETYIKIYILGGLGLIINTIATLTWLYGDTEQHQLVRLLMAPYTICSFLSPIVLSVGTYFGFVYSAKFVYKISKKVKQVSGVLDKHIADKDAHKLLS